LALVDGSIIQLNIDTGAGDLEITGKAGQSKISVVAKVFGEELSDDDYILSLKKEGDKAVLIARFNDKTYNSEKIDLEVSMPSSLALSVDDKSGDISIESVSNGLILNDCSGDVELSNIAGLVRIEDRSGDVVGEDLRGDVSINDRSGDININGAADFKLKNDGSGDVSLRNINSNLK
jgi:DUF4097 and DUF4098 domain-containing protein YvlB